MKYILVIFAFIIFLASLTVQAKDLSGCAAVTKKIGAACNNSPNSMMLIVNNKCSVIIDANACFETPDGKWECESDTIYADENGELAYAFYNCNTTGQYKLDLCHKVNGKLECGSKPKINTPYASLTCSNGKTLEFSIKPYRKGLFIIKTKSKKHATIRVRKDKKKDSYYISVDDISMVLCSEPVKASMVNILTLGVRNLVVKSEESWIKECAESHHPDWCKNEYILKQSSKVKNKMTLLGVRG